MGWRLRPPAAWVLNMTTHRPRAILALMAAGWRPGGEASKIHHHRYPAIHCGHRVAACAAAWSFGIGAVRASFSHRVIWPWLGGGLVRASALWPGLGASSSVG